MPTTPVLLARYGVIAEVAKFPPPTFTVEPRRPVVVRTRRGIELAEILDLVRETKKAVETDEAETTGEDSVAVLRCAAEDDLAAARRLRDRADADFGVWDGRIREWGLKLELLDLEWTLDGKKLILYVASDRGPETTQLALHAATLGVSVEVQPLGVEGPLPTSSGGCGDCGCH